MEGRKQFTFYRSYYEALKDLPRELRLSLLEAMIEFALDHTEPQSLEPIQRMAFTLIRPTLESGRKMAEGGQKNKGKKRSAKGGVKEKEEEDEEENEKENEIEIEDECLRAGFQKFWEIYPAKIGRDRAWEEWLRLKPDTEQVLAGVRRWGGSGQWRRENGRFVPRAEKFLAQKQFLDDPPGYVPTGGSGVLGKAELEAIEKIMGGGEWMKKDSGGRT